MPNPSNLQRDDDPPADLFGGDISADVALVSAVDAGWREIDYFGIRSWKGPGGEICSRAELIKRFRIGESD